jgi:hypothetical protein
LPETSDTSHTDEESRWRDIRAWCAKHAELLTKREREFINSMARWNGRPTYKQTKWLLIIERQIRARQSQ